jgi:hypothetical protein
MLGIKPIGALFSVSGILYGLILAGVIELDPPSFDLHSLTSPGLSGGLSVCSQRSHVDRTSAA